MTVETIIQEASQNKSMNGYSLLDMHLYLVIQQILKMNILGKTYELFKGTITLTVGMKKTENGYALDFDTVKAKFEEIVTKIITSHTEKEMEEVWTPKITQITEKYLGKGKKASQCTRDQVEMLNLIVIDLEDLIK